MKLDLNEDTTFFHFLALRLTGRLIYNAFHLNFKLAKELYLVI